MPRCPVCEGEGGWSQDFGEGTTLEEPCNYCPGTGQLSLGEWLGYWWYQYSPIWYQEWLLDRAERRWQREKERDA